MNPLRLAVLGATLAALASADLRWGLQICSVLGVIVGIVAVFVAIGWSIAEEISVESPAPQSRPDRRTR